MLSYGKLNEISQKIGGETKRPKEPLKIKIVETTESAKTGIRFLTKGWHDNYLYGVARLKLFRAKKVDDPATWEMGVNLPSTIYENILSLHVSNKGIVLISKKGGENPKVWFLSDINATPVLRHEFIFSPTTDTLNEFNITSHSDGVNDYIFACQYGMGTDHIRNMYFSKDLGTTWTLINQSIITTPGDLNSHWHLAKFDPYMGRIWAAQGDNSNSALSFSDDLGTTWKRFAGIYQPTMIHPFPDRVILGRDRGTAPPGFDHISRDYSSSAINVSPTLSFRSDKIAFHNYPGHHIVGYGEVAYIRFPVRLEMNEEYLFATGDGGKSWHCVYSTTRGTGTPYLGNPSGVTADGKIAFPIFNYGSGDLGTPLAYAEAIEWI